MHVASTWPWRRRASALAVLVASAVCLHADEPPTPSAGTMTVEVHGRADDLTGVASAATEGYVGAAELALRPLLRPGELLEAVPGVIITQHSGGGKANQYYLRGFNLDHGTDFRASVDGVPANMPSHAHGQGYCDVNFLIPELIVSEEYRKGPYDARTGDFSAAGSVDIVLARRLARPIVGIAGGSGYARVVAAGSHDSSAGTWLGAVEASRNDGPWLHPDHFVRLNGMARWSVGDDVRGGSVTLMGYSGRWDATDQVPRRAVASGRIDRLDAIDPTGGGTTHRDSLSGDWRQALGRATLHASAYVMHYDLQLFSNFTYFLDDPLRGDQFEQNDRRTVAGVDVSIHWSGLARRGLWSVAAGLSIRHDRVVNGLFHTAQRERLDTTRHDHFTLWGGGPFVQARAAIASRVTLTAGARADLYAADVTSDNRRNSGSAQTWRLSPKAGLIAGPWRGTEVYLNYGFGFHSNDARGATQRVDPRSGEPVARVTPLVRARGAEVGVRAEPLPGLRTTLAVFRLDLDSELVFVGDAGTTEAGRPSRRTGIEWTNFWRVGRHAALDLDVALSRGRFTNDAVEGRRIPGAVERVVAAGVALDRLGPFFGALRVRYFGPRDLVEDGHVRSAGSTLVNFSAGIAWRGGLRLSLEAFNVLGAESSDIDYFYASRLRHEAAAVDDVHFHPAEPRTLRLVAAWQPGAVASVRR